jgi:hypothetical protein
MRQLAFGFTAELLSASLGKAVAIIKRFEKGFRAKYYVDACEVDHPAVPLSKYQLCYVPTPITTNAMCVLSPSQGLSRSLIKQSCWYLIP